MSILSGMVNPKPPGRALALSVLAVAAVGCNLERRDEFLSHQYLVRDVDNSKAAQERLQQEYLREQAHVDRLTDEVVRLIDREEALALEAADWEFMVEEAEARLAELQQAKEAADAAIAAEEEAAAQREKAAEAEKVAAPPDDPAAIRARIEVLLAEVDALTRRLAEPPAAPTAPPAEEAPAEPAPAEEPAGG
ncbi:MAG: hypothetical protein ACF8XB_04865 [Planctomycetota bacterium JB042]